MSDQPLTKDEFVRRFVVHVLAEVGFSRFGDGTSVEAYALATAPSYYADPDQRADGPEACADSDMSYWGE